MAWINTNPHMFRPMMRDLHGETDVWIFSAKWRFLSVGCFESDHHSSCKYLVLWKNRFGDYIEIQAKNQSESLNLIFSTCAKPTWNVGRWKKSLGVENICSGRKRMGKWEMSTTKRGDVDTKRKDGKPKAILRLFQDLFFFSFNDVGGLADPSRQSYFA